MGRFLDLALKLLLGSTAASAYVVRAVAELNLRILARLLERHARRRDVTREEVVAASKVLLLLAVLDVFEDYVHALMELEERVVSGNYIR